ncbi:hypothetical protein [Polynucleobacter sp. UK-Kesae-W10]|uniref:hypothetical protein n=1 Tax=Polynucleobacter sp. UK-Kesae-W10 TaxID=1819738 RepID=UPI001C0AA0A5|nr:hypothetical protein [Polynucleobacter sp. UK-Kesae-W10]MBU3577602.1 hypothetical protein [Polynucleobacter sp. UK-Kesae-W10]
MTLQENSESNSETTRRSISNLDDVFSSASGPDVRAKIFALQDACLEYPQIDCPVKHHFAPGLYAREIFMPAGATVVGKIHKHAHVNTISQGRCIVTTEFGSEELAAPLSFVSKPGTKRAVHILEDTIWTTYHPTEETDLEKIEDHVIAKTYNDYLEFTGEEPKMIEGNNPWHG